MPTYSPLGWRTPAASVFILACGALSPVFVLDEIGVLGPPESEAGTLLLAAAVLGLFVCFAMAVVCFLLWTYRAAANLRALGRTGLEFGPAACVGWWFVPGANLYMPYRAMVEIWKASDPRPRGGVATRYWRAAAAPRLVRDWWVACLVGSISFWWSSVTPLAAEALGLFAIFGTVSAAVFAVRILRRVAANQELLRARVAQAAPMLAPGVQGAR